MGCKFSTAKFRRKRSKATRDDQEIGELLQKRNRGGKYEEYRDTPVELQGEASDKGAVKALVQVGLNENIANELVMRREKGYLSTTGDIAAMLDKNGTKYQLHIQDNILVRVNSLGKLSCEKFGDEVREELPKKSHTNSLEKININTASQNALEEIKGIGPTLAGRIVQYRQEHGPFAKVGDIVSVMGVSEKMLEKIKTQITVKSSKSNEIQDHEKKRTPVEPRIPKKFTPRDDTVRIASWNLLSFSSDKADNIGVREVVCCTILENG